jgi:hypothetical protein
MYGMTRTTVYFPEELIRTSVDTYVQRRGPRSGFLAMDTGGLNSENIDDFLEGFGED